MMGVTIIIMTSHKILLVGACISDVKFFKFKKTDLILNVHL